MKKTVLVYSGLAIVAVGVIAVCCSRKFWSAGFIPASIRNNFVLNANILPASDKSRSQYVAINPGFRAEFGDKQNPTSAFLRFEKTATSVNENADVDANLLDSLTAAQFLDTYNPGLEWQLFSVGVDESQLRASTSLAADEEVLKLAREMLGQELIATDESELSAIAAAVEKVQTETVVERLQGYDVVTNREVAENVDLRYTVVPGSGIASQIIIGDRDNFDTACLKLLSLTGDASSCALPNNKFSFLLQLDELQKLIHSPLSIDGGNDGTYYVVDEKNNFVARLGNFTLRDSSGAESEQLSVSVRPGQIDGQDIDGYYIVTVTVNLGWLIDGARQFPATVNGGFYVDGADFFAGELENNSYLLD